MSTSATREEQGVENETCRAFPLSPVRWTPKGTYELTPRGGGLPFAHPTVLREYTPGASAEFLPASATAPFGFHFRVRPNLDEDKVYTLGTYDPANQLILPLMGGPSATTSTRITKFVGTTGNGESPDVVYREDCLAD